MRNREKEKRRGKREKERERKRKKEKKRLRWRPMYTTVNEGTRRMLDRNMPLRYRETNLRSNMHRRQNSVVHAWVAISYVKIWG